MNSAGSTSRATESNTRAAGSGEPQYPSVEVREYELLDDLRETIEPFIRRQMTEGKNPYRFVYAFGSANATGWRSGENSDLGLLLRMIQEKQRTDDPSSMTYIYLFDTQYTEDSVRREVESMNRFFGKPRRESFNLMVAREGNSPRLQQRAQAPAARHINESRLVPSRRRRNTERRNSHFEGANVSISLRHEPFPTETFFPARYSFGPRCTLFFVNLYVPSHCKDIRSTYEGQQEVKRLGFVGTALVCPPAPGSAFAYLENLVQDLVITGGELYLYNCAWMDSREPGVGFYSENAYFEGFPEVLYLALYEYHPKKIHRYILYNQFVNHFKGEKIVVRSTEEKNNSRQGHLRQVPVTVETEFVRRETRSGGNRTMRRRRRNLKKSRKLKRG